MPVKTYKPTTPSRRGMTTLSFDKLTRHEPEKSLLAKRHQRAGRNDQGRITCRHKGGGHKKRYRVVDFRRDKDGVPARVAHIEYDPNRTAHLALLHYADGEKRYILAPVGLEPGASVQSGPGAEVQIGNCLPLSAIPLGTVVHCIEMQPRGGARMVKSAGAGAQVLAKEGNFVTLRLPSTEVRRFHMNCRATIGTVGNRDRMHVALGKAGRGRWLGRRPTVRGVVMNPIDHPMGGGEGRSSGGRHPCTPWGKPTKGLKTRKTKKASTRMIVTPRRKKKR